MTPHKNCILFVTGDRYPNGDAGAVRTHIFAGMLRDAGYEPVVIGYGPSTGFGLAEYDGISYYSLNYPRQDKVYRLLGRLRFQKHFARILKKLDPSMLGGILYVSGGKRVLDFLKKTARQQHIPLLYDAVEWYSPCEFKQGKHHPFYKKNDRMNRREVDASMRVIAISSFLATHFSGRGIPTIRVPFVLDMQTVPYSTEPSPSDKLCILYAGSPGRKDHLLELVQALDMAGEEIRRRCMVRLIGITRAQFEALYGWTFPEHLTDTVCFEGRKPRDYVVDQLQAADFSFLLRPEDERYAKAGFPTKATEGLSAGVPMLCNFTSDLALYLRDGENCIRIRDCSVAACAEALERIVSLTLGERRAMKCAARRTAETHLDQAVYRETVLAFFTTPTGN